MILTLLTGLLLFVGATCLGLHEILLSPDQPNYPTASRRVRGAMFVWMLTLYYRSVEVMVGAFNPEPMHVTWGMFAGTCALVILHGLWLEQVLRSWLPARLHARIRHLINIASCGRSEAVRRAREQALRGLWPGTARPATEPAPVGQALAELTLAGVPVIGPNEPPGIIEEISR